MKRDLRSSPRSSSSGYTLMELIIVIVIMGILSAVVLPKFSSLRAEAGAAAAKGLAAAIGSGSVMNYALFLANSAAGTSAMWRLSTSFSCSDANTALLQFSMATNYANYGTNSTAIGSANCAGGLGATVTCPIWMIDTGQSAVATLICTG